MNQFGLVDVAEDRLDFRRRLPQDARRLLRAVVDEPARDLAAVGIAAAADLSALEFAGDRGDADRQQALSVARESARGARVWFFTDGPLPEGVTVPPEVRVQSVGAAAD
jgi:hypothetical protein